MKFIMNTKWNGHTYSLNPLNCFCATKRRIYTFDNIQNNDPNLQAALTSIRINTNNMQEDFEAAITLMLPVCPYVKHRSSNGGEKCRARVNDATLQGKKHSKTGVDLCCWHNKVKYAKLTKEQRSELYNWQQTKDGNDKMSKDRNKGIQETGATKKQLDLFLLEDYQHSDNPNS